MKKQLLSLCLVLAATAATAQTQVTLDATADLGTNATAQVADSLTKDGVTMHITSGMLGNGTEYRFYAAQTLTISAEKEIQKIEFTCTANAGTAKNGPDQLATEQGTYTYAEKTGTWEGNADTVVFTTTKQCRATQIVVTLKDDALTATYQPADGATVETLAEDRPITLTFSDPKAVGFLYWDLRDDQAPQDDNYVCGGQSYPGEDGSFILNPYATIKLVSGHTYTLNVYAYAQESDSQGDWDYTNTLANFQAHYTGQGADYQYAEATLLTMTPAPQEVFVNPYQEMSFQFSAPVAEMTVAISGGMSGVSTPCETAATDQEGTAWKATLPASYLSACSGGFVVRATAKDADGRLVKGNAGDKETTHFEWEYSCYLGSPEFTTTPADQDTVPAIDTLRVSFPLGIAPSYNTTEKIQLYKGQQYILTVDPDKDFIYAATDETQGPNKYIDIVLPEAITEPGQYQFIFPTKYFNLGEEFSCKSSKQQVVRLTILDQKAQSVNFTTDPADGSTVESISEIIYTFDDEECVSNETQYPILVTDAEGNSVDDNAYLEWGDGLNQLILHLSKPITKPGTYTITIPAGDVTDTNGNYIEADCTITLTVAGTATAIQAVEAQEGTTRYNLLGQRVKANAKGLIIEGGKKTIRK